MKLLSTIIISCLFTLVQDQTQEVLASLNNYRMAVLSMDATKVSDCFAIDGMLGDKMKGREAIKYYLLSYKKTKVIDYVLETKSLKINGNVANHEGLFAQKVVTNNSNVIENKGKFRIVWVKESGYWKISSFTTELVFDK